MDINPIDLLKNSDSLTGKVYDDLAHPSAKSIGNTLSFLPRTVGVWLGKWEKWIINGEESIHLTAKAVEERVKTIPEEDLTEPESYVAVPAIQQLSYCYDSEELRKMYANLLASSMDKRTKFTVHPSFVDIIKQLSPDEARFLKKIAKGQSFPLIDLKLNLKNGGYLVILRNYTNVGEDVCDNPNGIFSYIDNCIRLGLIEIPSHVHINDDKTYEPLETHPYITGLKTGQLQEGQSYSFERKVFQVTSFGRDFMKTCID